MDIAVVIILIIALVSTGFKQRKQKARTSQVEKMVASLQESLEHSTNMRRSTDLELSATKKIVDELKRSRNIEKELHKIEIKRAEKLARADALSKSKAVSHGFSSENFAPLLMDHNHKDFRHMGDPVDFIVFSGSDSVRRKEQKELNEIVLLDIKTGNAQLNSVQRRIRDAVVDGRVRFAVYNTDTKKTRVWPEQKGDANDTKTV